MGATSLVNVTAALRSAPLAGAAVTKAAANPAAARPANGVRCDTVVVLNNAPTIPQTVLFPDLFAKPIAASFGQDPGFHHGL